MTAMKNDLSDAQSMSSTHPTSADAAPGTAARRAFLRRAARLAAVAGSPLALNLALPGSASAQTVGDYKALVCVFLNGGNDQSNTVVPRTGTAYTAYRDARPALALAPETLLPISPLEFRGPALGLHPQLTGLQSLFTGGQCAILANVGMLSQPLNKSQWNGGDPTARVPYQLFSHSDQAAQWQSASPNGVSDTGWFGRLGDVMTPLANPESLLSICLSVSGDNLLQAGARTIPYQLTTNGAVEIDRLDSLLGSAKAGAALRKLLTAQRTHLMEAQYVDTTRRAIGSAGLINRAVDGVTLRTAFPETRLGSQLHMVARMIAAQARLKQGRQLFYVSAGGWDFHDNLLTDQASRLAELDAALSAFYAATAELGVAGSVTSFTASDFGRGLQSNGRGSDHGWGSHHFIVGAAVRGGRVYGRFPTVALGGPEDAGQGRLIPTTSLDQYAATLARWFGVTQAADLATMLPNLANFRTVDLGFMG